MAATYDPSILDSTVIGLRNQVRFRTQDTGPTSFLFQDEEVDYQIGIETSLGVPLIYFAAAHLLQTKLLALGTLGGGISERVIGDLKEKFGLSEDGRLGEVIQLLIDQLLVEGNRRLTKPQTFRVIRSKAR